jgi:hypothetical protein
MSGKIGTLGGFRPSQANVFWWMLARVGAVCLDGVKRDWGACGSRKDGPAMSAWRR